ncbi:ABC transporter permease subunit [Bradyrhizobium sp.]|uniref:ABC transporter permease n=1 Tax=Bradyrhizobium sp. TaxID=376 RepID=UPI00238CE9B4|nr:ABC transporter permease subunit [Bradyrhizobium sp.]MDE2375769.1 ABC transporter permease subunit [Bradyrhizobium sp.]
MLLASPDIARDLQDSGLGSGLAATFRLEVSQALRARWFWAYAAVFFGLVGLLLVFGLTESRVLGFTGLSRTLVAYIQLSMAILPIFVLITTVRSLAGDREAGVYEYVLGLPVGIGGWYAGRFFARYALAVAPVLGALVSAVAYGAARGVAIPWVELGFDIGLLLAMILAFVGLGFFIASVASSVDLAQTAAFLLWLVLILGLDLVLLGVLIRDRMPVEGVVAIALLNPLQVFRIGSMVLFDPQLVLLGSTAYAVFDVFGRVGFMVWSLAYPLALGIGAAYAGFLVFRRGDLL